MLAGLAASSPGYSGRAQTVGWEKIYDEPTAFFTSVEMFDDERGIASAAGGFFYTADGGATWAEGTSDIGVNLGGLFGGTSYISFGDEDSAWVAGFNGQLWHTPDGGRSWARQDVNTRSHFNSVTAVSEDEAWAASWGEGFSDVGPGSVPTSLLFHTEDGGATWARVRLDGYGAFHQVEFVDRRHGWLIASTCSAGESFQTCDFLRDRVVVGPMTPGGVGRELPLSTM